MAHDLVIRGGTVVDGTGRPGRRADVAVDGGRIRAIGRVTESGRREIDAEAHTVSPGFIDAHTHMDAQAFWDPLGSSSCWHGVTTTVMGNTGFTLAPVRPNHPELVLRNLERAEDIPASAMAIGVPFGWEHFSEYLDALDGVDKAINYSGYIGHSALRTWAMGERAFTEDASDDDLDLMRAELRDAMEAGAMGFSTSRGTHLTSDLRPVASRRAPWDELSRLVGVLSEVGQGLFEISLPDSVRSSGSPDALDVYAKLKALALSCRRPITFGVSPQPWVHDLLHLIDETVAAGGSMVGQSHCRGTFRVASFKTRLPFDVLPGWMKMRALPLVDQRRALLDPDSRRALVEEADHGEYPSQLGLAPPKPDYATMRVFDAPVPPHRLVGDVAHERGVHPVDLIIDLALASDFDQLFLQPPVADASDDLIEEVLRHPHSVMTFSDAGAHASMIADCSLPTHLLAYWVRERQHFTLEEGVRMLTERPAAAWGMVDRGVVREGAIADLNVFDPDTVAPRMPTVEHDLPGGARRFRQLGAGLHATIVAGTPILMDGVDTGARPGRIIRGGR